MAQRLIYFSVFLILGAFVWAVIYRLARPSEGLKENQKTGCFSGGCLFPCVFLFVALLGNDFGGPGFWPVSAVFGAMLGIVFATLYFICRQKR